MQHLVEPGPELEFLRREARRRRRRVAVVALTLVTAIAGALIVLRSGSAPTTGGPASPLAPDAPLDPYPIRAGRERLVEAPCDADARRALVAAYNEYKRYPEAVAEVDAHARACGADVELLWSKLYSLQQAGQWPASLEVASALVREEPDDPDYWWWRGKSYVALSRIEDAAADFRQAIANSEIESSNGAHVMHFAEVAERLGRPCEGAAALAYYADQGHRLNAYAEDLAAQLGLRGDCARSPGTGTVRLRMRGDKRLVETTARVGALRGRFLVDPRSAFVAVSPAMAQRLGLAPAAQTVETRVAFVLQPVRLTRVPSIALGAATATDVDVAVSERLPPGVDGVIGLSFLWRFHVSRTDAALVLAPR